MLDRLSRSSSWDAGRRWPIAACVVAVRAALLLPVAALAVRGLRLERALRLVASVPLPSLGPGCEPAAPIAHVVHAVTSRLGGGCLTRAVVLHAVLTRRGRPAVVVIGTRRVGLAMRAHAWVELDGRVLSVDGANGYLALCRLDRRGAMRSAAA